MEQVLTIKLDDHTSSRLAEIAQSIASTEASIAAVAIEEYVNNFDWQVQAIYEGLRDADAEDVMTHDEIRRYWESRIADTLDKSGK